MVKNKKAKTSAPSASGNSAGSSGNNSTTGNTQPTTVPLQPPPTVPYFYPSNVPIPPPVYPPGMYPYMPVPMPMPMQYYAPYTGTTSSISTTTTTTATSRPSSANQSAPPSVNSAPWHSTPIRPSYSNAVAPAAVPAATAKVNIQISKNQPSSTTTNNARPISVSTPTTTTTATSKWSAPMKAYVERCFATCKSPAEKDAMEELLRVKIKVVLGEGKMNAIFWEREPIPQVGIIRGNISSNSSPMKNATTSNASNTNSKPKLTQSNDTKLLERQKRFEADEREFRLQQARNRLALQNVSIADNQADVPDWDEETIVGTCQKLEKPYLRLTSAPDPATVRPLPVLKRALEWLKDKWRAGGAEYGFICDQFKSLRQDMTVQRIKSEFTVSVYEIHARIAIEQGDWGEYNQCQTQLKQLYRSGLKGSEQEFLAYRLLYLLQCGDKLGICEFLQKESASAEDASGPVEHALAVQEALQVGNHARLFELYRAAPNMGVYLMDLLVQRERLRAFKAILRAYRPVISLDLIQRRLGFGGDEGECKEWLKGIGVTGSNNLDCKQTLSLLIE